MPCAGVLYLANERFAGPRIGVVQEKFGLSLQEITYVNDWCCPAGALFTSGLGL